jgi:hypothetical protein
MSERVGPSQSGQKTSRAADLSASGAGLPLTKHRAVPLVMISARPLGSCEKQRA